MRWLSLLILSTLILIPGCANPDSPNRSRLGIPVPLDPKRPSPNRTITRKVDNAKQRVQQTCAQMKALGLPPIGCEAAEDVLDLPRQAGAR